MIHMEKYFGEPVEHVRHGLLFFFFTTPNPPQGGPRGVPAIRQDGAWHSFGCGVSGCPHAHGKLDGQENQEQVGSQQQGEDGHHRRAKERPGPE